MLVFREESHILRDVNVFYRNKRCFRSDTLQHCLCLITERTIRFGVELELYRWGLQKNRLKAKIKFIFLREPKINLTSDINCETMVYIVKHKSMNCEQSTTPR